MKLAEHVARHRKGAEKALRSYALTTDEESIRNLLTDLLHVAAAKGIDERELVAQALRNFDWESDPANAGLATESLVKTLLERTKEAR